MVGESINPPISSKNKIDTLNKTDKSQVSNKTVDTPKSNKNDKVKSIDRSRSTQRTDMVNTVNKSRYITGNSFSDISTGIEKPTEIDIVKDNKSFMIFLYQEINYKV